MDLREKHKIINKTEAEAIEDPCGILREIYVSENLSIAHVVTEREARRHKHQKMEEVYYVVKGEGKVKLGEDVIDISEGDIVPIPKDVLHNLIPGEEPIEILAITYPKYDPDDMIFE